MRNIWVDVPCFFMVCTKRTERECLNRGLFGDREWVFPRLKAIKEGDIGFLMNLSNDELIGIFVAESKARLNIEPDAWGGEFPAQVKVKCIGEIKRIQNATNKLERIIKFNVVQKYGSEYKLPVMRTYGPEITNQVLSFFELPENFEELLHTSKTERIPELSLENVAGLKKIKEFVYQRIIAPFEDEERAYRLKIRIGGGILLFGPPGTGKTLIAEAIAKNIEGKFIEISPSIIMGYPGEAEKRIENIFHALDKEPRAVVFLDEAEWILTRREEQTSSVMQRITPLLLAQLSRILKEKTKPIIIIAATNKPEIIDCAFLRPGRFDKIFYVGLPDKEARKEIINLHIKNRDHTLTEDDVSEIAEQLEGYSGADIEHIIAESAFLAFQRRDKINKEYILEIIKHTSKSVSSEEVTRMEEWAKQRGVII